METIVIEPKNVCAKEITVVHENGVIKSVKFVRGCSGNTQGIAALLVGRRIEEIIPLLENIKCPGSRTGQTSCPQELAVGLKNALK